MRQHLLLHCAGCDRATGDVPTSTASAAATQLMGAAACTMPCPNGRAAAAAALTPAGLDLSAFDDAVQSAGP